MASRIDYRRSQWEVISTADCRMEGTPNTAHSLEKRTGMTLYRAHAYHSWKRGCNENFNGLLRRYFPKGTDFSTLNQADIDVVAHQLNHRPRKRLNYLTPS